MNLALLLVHVTSLLLNALLKVPNGPCVDRALLDSEVNGLTEHSSSTKHGTMQRLRSSEGVFVGGQREWIGAGAALGISTQNGNSQPPTCLTSCACTV